MEAAWRLIWALPLVLGIGVVAAFILRRFVIPVTPAVPRAPRVSLRESLVLSEDTRAHFIEVEGQAFLVVESARQTALHPLAHIAEAPRATMRPVPAWAQRLLKGHR